MFLDDSGINLIRQLVKIKEGAEEHDDGEDDDNASHHTIDDKDAGVVKLASHLVDKPRQSEPPQQGAAHYAGITHRHLDGTVWHYEGKLCEEEDEEEDNQRIGQRYEERRHAVVHECALLRLVALMDVTGWIGAVTVDAE